MRWLFTHEPVFTVEQFDRLSNIFDNAGQVVFGVVVLSPIISGFEKVNWLVIIFGIMIVALCWIMSIWFAKKGKI